MLDNTCVNFNKFKTNKLETKEMKELSPIACEWVKAALNEKKKKGRVPVHVRKI